MRIAVTGASGFVGTHLCRALTAEGHEVVAIARGKRKQVRRAGVTWLKANVSNPAALAKAFTGCDAVVHLTAIERERRGQTFDGVNRQGAANVAQAAHDERVPHLLYLGALGADPDPRYPFIVSKWSGEQAVRASGVQYSIIRASVIAGPGDEFFTKLARLMRLNVVAPVPGNGRTLFQPISVFDVVQCITKALADGPSQAAQDIGGPEHLSLEHIVRTIKNALGIHRRLVHMPLPAMAAAARLMSVLPNPPVTPGEVALLQRNNITALDAVRSNFGFSPRRFSESCDYLDDY